MSRLQFGGFCLIAAIAAVGVDYVNQSRLAGDRPGGFGPGAYAASIGTRFLGFRQAQEAEAIRRTLRAGEPRKLLPEAPEGWQRRDWTEADAARLASPPDRRADPALAGAIRAEPAAQILSRIDAAATARDNDREVHVYERGEEIVALRLTRRATAPEEAAARPPARGFAMIGGLAFADSAAAPDPAAADPVPRRISARLGEEAEISALALATDASIRTLLAAIDYDRLNASLDHPLAGVGNDATVPDPEQSRALAEAAIARADGAQTGAAQNASAPAASAAADPAAAPPSAIGGVFTTLARLITGGSATGGSGAEVQINRRGGSGSKCSSDRGFKRCSLSD